MIENDQYCMDVLTQVSATTGLHQVALGLFDDHLRDGVTNAVAVRRSDANRKVREATAAVEWLRKR